MRPMHLEDFYLLIGCILINQPIIQQYGQKIDSVDFGSVEENESYINFSLQNYLIDEIKKKKKQYL